MSTSYDHSGITDPWHPENCTPCHDAQIAEWNQTGHYTGTIFNGTHYIIPVSPTYNITRTPADFAEDCASCRSTRFDNSTGTPTWWDVGVTCAACHNEPGEINHTATTCGQCHYNYGDHLYQYDDYLLSGHSNSLSDLLDTGYAQDACTHCMSGQSLYAEDMTYNPIDLWVNNTDLVDISCATCHDPHSAENDYQLRIEDETDLCGSCHGTAERHREYEFLTDATTKSPHYGVDCTTCHGYQLMNATTGEYRINHTWALDLPAACSQNGTCHANPESRVTMLETIQNNWNTSVEAWEDMLENVTAKVDEANATDGIDRTEVEAAYALIEDAEELASWAVYDGSEGFHNNALVTAKLSAAMTKLNEAYQTAADAIKNAEEEDDEGIPGFEFVSIFAALGLLSLGVLLLRRRKR